MATKYMDDIARLISRIEEEAYQRGRADEKRELFAYLSAQNGHVMPDDGAKDVVEEHHASVVSPSPSAVNVASDETRQRAPKGIVPKFVKRILSEAERGMTAKDIIDSRESHYEKMIKDPSIRSELRTGKIAGRYTEDGGLWYMANKEKADG